MKIQEKFNRQNKFVRFLILSISVLLIILLFGSIGSEKQNDNHNIHSRLEYLTNAPQNEAITPENTKFTPKSTEANTSETTVKPKKCHHIYLLDKKECPIESKLDNAPEYNAWPSGHWIGEVDQYNDGKRRVLPFTHFTQQFIFEHQNPQNCSGKKFYEYVSPNSGIGSMLHGLGVALAHAVHDGKILISTKAWYANIEFCHKSDKSSNYECFFLPLSNCTSYASANPSEVTQLHPSSLKRELVPSIFVDKLKTNTEIVPGIYYWWWRAQSVAYIVRPNEKTLNEIKERISTRLVGKKLEKGCVSVHVRHGDKGKESPVYSSEEHDEGVSQILKADNSLTHQLFVSTEDQQVIDYFTSDPTRPVSYLKTKMKNEHEAVVSALTNNQDEFLDSLSTLSLALQCDGFVGSFYSNWIRLIDELRATVRGKADAVFQNVKFPMEDRNW